jgi:hypothetical protein
MPPAVWTAKARKPLFTVSREVLACMKAEPTPSG